MRIMHPTKRSVGVDGETYNADDDGIIDVPDDATSLLHPAHGFAVVSELEVSVSVEAELPKRRRRKVTDDDALHDSG